MQHKNKEIMEHIENFINDYVDSNGVSPTQRDIASGLGIVASTVTRYLSAMEEEGKISYDEHRKVITKQMQNDLNNSTRTQVRRISIIGSIECGVPKDVEEYIEETVKLPKSIFGDGPLFILHASGESMIEAGIDDGDLVVIKQQETANVGDIVVALTNDGTTLKGYFPEPENKRIRLQPANKTMKPMYYKDIIIQGIVEKVIKNVKLMI